MAFKKIKKEYNYLEMTPVRNYDHIVKEDGLINVLVPKFTDKILSRLLMPRISKPFIKANLDEFGTEVWLQLDGKTIVIDIADRLAEKFGDKIQPVNERLLVFLTQLYKAGFITFNEFRKD